LKVREQHRCPRYVTTSFIAEHCGVSSVTVLSWIEELRLPAFRLPKGHYRICRDDFIEFMEKNNIPISVEER
jgi:excisionase family DNA binding protein